MEDIFINESRKNVEGFHCPILQCGKNFQKSCDLTFHFNIEVEFGYLLDWEQALFLFLL